MLGLTSVLGLNSVSVGAVLKSFVISPVALTSSASGIDSGSAMASFTISNNESTFVLVLLFNAATTAAVYTLACSIAAIVCNS